MHLSRCEIGEVPFWGLISGILYADTEPLLPRGCGHIVHIANFFVDLSVCGWQVLMLPSLVFWYPIIRTMFFILVSLGMKSSTIIF
jgi:hypothetical protein